MQRMLRRMQRHLRLVPLAHLRPVPLVPQLRSPLGLLLALPLAGLVLVLPPRYRPLPLPHLPLVLELRPRHRQQRLALGSELQPIQRSLKHVRRPPLRIWLPLVRHLPRQQRLRQSHLGVFPLPPPHLLQPPRSRR